MEYTLIPSDVDVTSPLIYMWEIRDATGEVVGRYIGKANGGDKRPTKHYPRNVRKLRGGLPYKTGKNYRKVHYGLADAEEAGHKITLSYLCNVKEDENIFAVERRYIQEYGCDADNGIGLNGPWRGQPHEIPKIAFAIHDVEDQRENDDDMPNLEDVMEFIEARYAKVFDEARARKNRYSFWIAGQRIFRAMQPSPNGKVSIKLAQTSIKAKKDVEFAWDGTERQLSEAVDGELMIFNEGRK